MTGRAPGLRRVLVAVVVAGTALLAHPRLASACSCYRYSTFDAALIEYDAVFVGTVTSRRSVGSVDRGFEIIDFVVLDAIRTRGEIRAGRAVQVATSGGSCGYAPPPGTTHIIFAHGNRSYRALVSRPPLSMNTCAPLLPVSEAAVAPWLVARQWLWGHLAFAAWRAAAVLPGPGLSAPPGSGVALGVARAAMTRRYARTMLARPPRDVAP